MHVLDNPIWSSLVSRHRAFARGDGRVARYPADVAPFLGIADGAGDVDAALDALVAPDESVYLLGARPPLPAGWRSGGPYSLAQMVCEAPVPDVDGPPITALTDAHRDDVLALTALVYPHYFRPRTMDLGRYFGIYDGGLLAAIIGERMATDDWQEISAVCTHPDCNGRGLARRLLAWLGNDILAAGRVPFLHVSNDNTRAKALYERNGYRTRIDIDFWSLQAPAR